MQVQRLFQNRCSRRSVLVLLRGTASSMQGVHRAAATAVAALSIAIVLSGLAGASAPLGGPVGPLVPHPWASFDSGAVRAVFPSPLPVLDMFPSANASVGVTVGVAAVYEVNLSGAVPEVVAAAFPAAADSFGSPVSPAASAATVGFSAPLTIAAVQGPLGATVPPLTVGSLGSAARVNLTFAVPGPGAGSVGVDWAVAAWPYVAPADSLAVVLSVGLFPSATMTACGASPSASTAPCDGTPITNGTLVPDVTIGSVAAALPGGARMALEGLGQYTTWIAGTGPTAATVSLVAPATGPSAAAGGFSISLANGPVAPILRSITGSPLAFGLAASLAGGAAIAAIAIARRRDRRLIDEL